MADSLDVLVIGGGQARRHGARQVVLNTGTRNLVPPVPGLVELAFVHAGNWLEAPELPARLAVLGSGAVGLEMAQFYRRVGSDVTVVDTAGIVAQEDEDVAAAVRGMLEGEGIDYRPGAKVQGIALTNAGAPWTVLRDAVQIHPTFSEALQSAVATFD